LHVILDFFEGIFWLFAGFLGLPVILLFVGVAVGVFIGIACFASCHAWASRRELELLRRKLAEIGEEAQRDWSFVWPPVLAAIGTLVLCGLVVVVLGALLTGECGTRAVFVAIVLCAIPLTMAYGMVAFGQQPTFDFGGRTVPLESLARWVCAVPFVAVLFFAAGCAAAALVPRIALH